MRCQRVSLIKKDGCFVCKGSFILESSKPDSYMANIQKYNQEKINKQKQKQYGTTKNFSDLIKSTD